MEITFWLLDVDHGIENQILEVRLYSVDDSGNKVLTVDRNFLAYFHTVIKRM